MKLTGELPTSELRAIGNSKTVTVTVARTVQPENRTTFESYLSEIETSVAAFPGCLGVGVFRPGPYGNEYQIVFRFVDIVALRQWEKSSVRAEALASIEPYVEATEVSKTFGAARFLRLPDLAGPDVPKHHRLVFDVLWVWPIAMTVSALIGPHLTNLRFRFSTLVGVFCVTTAMTFLVNPIRERVRKKRTKV
jgi:uncharacterized protein